MWRQLPRDGTQVARCTVERLMRELGLTGRTRGAKRRTTIPAEASGVHLDRVNRRFSADAPYRLWIADITYVATWSGFAYTAFVTDVFSRRVVGWRVANTGAPIWPLTRWRWPSGADATASPGWCTTRAVSMWGRAPGRPDPHSDGPVRIAGAGRLPGFLTRTSD
jgi:hypothetical protein